MATYGSFPGVRVTTESGGISSISIGSEEKLVLFGESSYDASNNVEGDDTSLNVSASEPEQISAQRVADAKFGAGSELAEGMKEALANGSNINFLFGVAVPRVDVTGETFNNSASATGTLDNVEVLEDTSTIDLGADATVKFRYGDGSGGSAPANPTADDTVHLNPLTGEYAVTSGSATNIDAEIDYTFSDYSSAFGAEAVRNVVNEDETGVYAVLSDSDSVSSSLASEVSTLRDDYQLVTAISVAEPNSNELLDDANSTDANGGADARYDPANYANANQSVSDEYFFKVAPGREQNVSKTIVGGVGGLFAGNAISNPIYNDSLTGYQSLEQSLSKTDADNLRDEDIIPVRSGVGVRVQGNRATNFSENDTVAAEFWTRRITDRVILIGKQVGDEIIGRINDSDTRKQAERLINAQMRQLVRDDLIESNGESQNWNVDVFEDPNDRNQVKIDIAFTPYGIVKRVDETITVNTN
jgi:hypothetical protein